MLAFIRARKACIADAIEYVTHIPINEFVCEIKTDTVSNFMLVRMGQSYPCTRKQYEDHMTRIIFDPYKRKARCVVPPL